MNWTLFVYKSIAILWSFQLNIYIYSSYQEIRYCKICYIIIHFCYYHQYFWIMVYECEKVLTDLFVQQLYANILIWRYTGFYPQLDLLWSSCYYLYWIQAYFLTYDDWIVQLNIKLSVLDRCCFEQMNIVCILELEKFFELPNYNTTSIISEGCRNITF